MAGTDVRARPDATTTGGRRPGGGGRDAGIAIRLFDADRTDHELDLDAALRRRVGSRQLLWIDVDGRPEAESLAAIAERMELRPMTRRALEEPAAGPHVAVHGAYMHVRVAVVDDEHEDGTWLDLIAARNVVLTRHPDPVDLLRHLDERIEADSGIGALDAPAFVATALDVVVTTYYHAVDAIETTVDQLDAQALSPLRHPDVLSDLVRVRRRIARLRRVLTGQREVFAALAAPDVATAAERDVDAFRAVATRFEGAVQSVENSRELLIGSFEVFMTRTSQRTNDIMKVLALATVLLLPGSLIAGLLGMNVVVPLPKDDAMSFWLVVGAIVVLACLVLVAARMRRWI